MARSSSSSGSSDMLFKGGLFVVLAGIAYWLFGQFSGAPSPTAGADPVPEGRETTATRPEAARSLVSTVPPEIMPAGGKGELVRHTYFALSYVEDAEQAEWVAFELTRDRLRQPWVERANTFRPDDGVRTESATPRDYNSSGYDKGHLCAAADMAFDEQAMDETFFMSNMSPQVKAFNGGIWRELEEDGRDWAKRFKKLYVVTGPVLTEKPVASIGFSKVAVPRTFYKVFYAPEAEKAIAFLIPNQASERPLMDYACTIDAVEEKTGLDFFPKLLGDLNEELEGSLDKEAWPVNPNRYRKRLEEWNR